MSSPAPKLDAVDLAFENAPEDTRPVTDEETAALLEARAEVEAGAPLIPQDEMMKRLRARFDAE